MSMFKRKPVLELYESLPGGGKGCKRWRLRAGNGEIIATGEGYVTDAARMDSLRLLGTILDPNSYTIKQVES